MTAKPLPPTFKLARGVGRQVLTDEYEHWTVADVIGLLEDYDPNSRVWIQVGKNKLAPLEMMFGTEGEVIL